VSYTLLNREDLPYDRNTYEFQGMKHQDTHVSRQFVTHWLEDQKVVTTSVVDSPPRSD
jgi:hypothetical protein